jgi:quinol monooxygenase YgiN
VASGNRPYGRLSIFTLLDDKVAEFDRLAEQAAEGVRVMEPDTLVYVMHVVPKAPMQRIIYEIYRDHAAFERHQRQPHIQEFEEGRRPCVLVTNIIDLRLKYAKVAPLQGTPQPSPGASPGQPPLPPGARHRAGQGPQGPEPDGGAWFSGERPPGRGADQDGEWAADRSFDSVERRSQDWGPSQHMGQRYRDN